MPRYVHVPTDATTHLIRQAYDAGGAYQWAREGWRNSDESGASRIIFDVERQAVTRQGVLRRVILDDGAGMGPDDMRDFLTTFGGGGKPIGVDSNFGQGFKSSVLPWNPYGVVVISYTVQNPDGAMLWIERDGKANYRLHEWESQDEFGDVTMMDVVRPFADDEHGCDWSMIRPDWLMTGTIMVLLGDGPRADTIEGDPDPARCETAKGLLKYLNSRLLDVPVRDNGAPVDTTVVVLERVQARTAERRATKDITVELPSGEVLAIHQRKVRGTKAFIPSSAVSGDPVRVDEHGTTVEWFYVPEPAPAVSGSADYIGQKPVVVVDYQGEAYHADTSVHRYRQFGVTDEIRGRTWLIVKPPVYSDQRPTKWGVLTQASRNMLIARGGSELPWEQWGDAFYEAFPRELSDARDRARAATTVDADPNTAKKLARILDRLNPRFKASRLVTSAFGAIAGFETGSTQRKAGKHVVTTVTGASGPGGRGESSGGNRPFVSSPDGSASGKMVEGRGGYPSFDWKVFDDEDSRKYLADYNAKDSRGIDSEEQASNGVVYLNIKHPVFVEEFRYWSSQVWPKADPSEVSKLVMSIYGQEAVAHVVHAQRLNGSVIGRGADGKVERLGRSEIEELTSKAALSAALLGLVNVEQRILTSGGGLFGSRSAS